MRPVVASIDTPSSRLSKMLSDILRSFVEVDNEYDVKNSFIVKDMLCNMPIEDTERMVSFDIVSLFTNIPVNLALNTIEEQWNLISEKTNIPKDLFLRMLRFCLLDANYFVFQSKFYKQIFGMPMGNLLSTIIADITTKILLDSTRNNFGYTPKIFAKYVDDIFTIIPKNSIEKTLNALNSFHPRIQFTVELEANNRLPYLDMMILRNNHNKIETDWYQKSICSSRVLNFHSHHPLAQKLNTANNLVNRVLSLSSKKYHKKNQNIVKGILELNNYPAELVEGMLRSQVFKINNQINTKNSTVPYETKTENITLYKSMTYSKGLSEKIEKIIRTYTTHTKLAFTNRKTIGNLFTKLKDRTPSMKKTNVIYKIPCLGNEDLGESCEYSYVGQTKQYLDNRLKNHKYDLKKTPNPLIPRTALTDHFHTSNHYPNFSAVKILGTQPHFSKRLTLEALHIYSENTYNFKRDTENLVTMYCALIDDNKNKSNNKKRRINENINPYEKRQRLT